MKPDAFINNCASQTTKTPACMFQLEKGTVQKRRTLIDTVNQPQPTPKKTSLFREYYGIMYLLVRKDVAFNNDDDGHTPVCVYSLHASSPWRSGDGANRERFSPRRACSQATRLIALFFLTNPEVKATEIVKKTKSTWLSLIDSCFSEQIHYFQITSLLI